MRWGADVVEHNREEKKEKPAAANKQKMQQTKLGFDMDEFKEIYKG